MEVEKENYRESLLSSLESEILDNSSNTSPIVTMPLDQHKGIEAEVQVVADDVTPMGQMCYVTFFRNNRIRMPHDGYGLAWRKQPDFLVRLDQNSYEDSAQREADIEEFKNMFDTDPVSEGVIGNISGRPEYQFYNVYLVDNNVLKEEVQIGTNRVFDSQNGINQYLQKAKV